MSNEQEEAVREFIYFIQETGELRGSDSDFLKANYYDFKEWFKNKTTVGE